MRTQMVWPGQAGAQMDKLRPASPTFLLFAPFILLEFRYGLQARPGTHNGPKSAPPPGPNSSEALTISAGL